MKFSINDVFSRCNQIHSFLRIWSHLLKKYLTENFIFLCSERFIVQTSFSAIKAVSDTYYKQHCTGVASRVSKWLETKAVGNLRNLEKISKSRDDRAYCLVSSPEIKLYYQWSKFLQKQISKLSSPVQFWLISLLGSTYFVRDCNQMKCYVLKKERFKILPWPAIFCRIYLEKWKN